MRWYKHFVPGFHFCRACNNRLKTPIGTFVWGNNEDVMNVWGFEIDFLKVGGCFFQSETMKRSSKNKYWYLFSWLFGEHTVHYSVPNKVNYASVVYKGDAVPVMYGTVRTWCSRGRLPWLKTNQHNVTRYDVGYGERKLMAYFDDVVSESEVLRHAKFKLRVRDVDAS